MHKYPFMSMTYPYKGIRASCKRAFNEKDEGK